MLQLRNKLSRGGWVGGRVGGGESKNKANSAQLELGLAELGKSFNKLKFHD